MSKRSRDFDDPIGSSSSPLFHTTYIWRDLISPRIHSLEDLWSLFHSSQFFWNSLRVLPEIKLCCQANIDGFESVFLKALDKPAGARLVRVLRYYLNSKYYYPQCMIQYAAIRLCEEYARMVIHCGRPMDWSRALSALFNTGERMPLYNELYPHISKEADELHYHYFLFDLCKRGIPERIELLADEFVPTRRDFIRAVVYDQSIKSLEYVSKQWPEPYSDGEVFELNMVGFGMSDEVVIWLAEHLGDHFDYESTYHVMLVMTDQHTLPRLKILKWLRPRCYARYIIRRDTPHPPYSYMARAHKFDFDPRPEHDPHHYASGLECSCKCWNL